MCLALLLLHGISHDWAGVASGAVVPAARVWRTCSGAIANCFLSCTVATSRIRTSLSVARVRLPHRNWTETGGRTKDIQGDQVDL